MSQQVPQRKAHYAHLALYALLQRFAGKTTCQAPLTGIRLQSVVFRKLGLYNGTHEQVQKPYSDVERYVAGQPLYQTFCVHRPGLHTAVRFAILARIDRAEGPTRAIFERRLPIRIEKIAFVEDSVGDFLDLL